MLSGRCLDGVLWDGHDLEKFVIAVSCRLSPDCVQILPNANRLCRIRSGTVPSLIRNSAIIPTSESRQLQNTIRLSPDNAVCNAVQQNVIGLRSDSVPIIPNTATVVGFQMRGFPDSAGLLTSGV